MSRVKVDPERAQHRRGPKPATLPRWVLRQVQAGAKRFAARMPDGSVRLLAHKNAPDTAKRAELMKPIALEALDKDGCELGIWTFPEPEDVTAPSTEEVPGYLKEEGDTPDERLLKTFAHLIADAHKLASQQLVATVGIQSKHFSEERQNLLKAQLINERLLMRRLRGHHRYRIAEDGAEGDEGADEGEAAEASGDDDGFLKELLQPLIAKYVAKAGGQVAESIGAGAAAHANGAAKEKGT